MFHGPRTQTSPRRADKVCRMLHVGCTCVHRQLSLTSTTATATTFTSVLDNILSSSSGRSNRLRYRLVTIIMSYSQVTLQSCIQIVEVGLYDSHHYMCSFFSNPSA